MVGHALLCADARYLSVQVVGASRAGRRFPSPAEWTGILRQLADRLPAGPLEADSPMARLVAGARGADVTVQYLAAVPIDAEPHTIALVLDARLGLLQESN